MCKASHSPNMQVGELVSASCTFHSMCSAQESARENPGAYIESWANSLVVGGGALCSTVTARIYTRVKSSLQEVQLFLKRKCRLGVKTKQNTQNQRKLMSTETSYEFEENEGESDIDLWQSVRNSKHPNSWFPIAFHT